MADTRDDLTRIRRGRAALREATHEAATAISDLDVRPGRQAEDVQELTEQVGSRKLAEANRKGAEMERELRTLCAGVIQRLESIGIQVATAGEFRGAAEKTLAFVGKLLPGALESAHRRRLERLEQASVDDALAEVQAYAGQTIAELGEIEDEYKGNVTSYSETLDIVLTKLREATPKQLAAEARRTTLEAEFRTLELELQSGTVAQVDRPQAEQRFEALKRDLEASRLEALEYVTIVTQAQRALPDLQASKDAASRSIESLHAMRRDLLEKLENLSVILKHGMTAVRARARLERYQAVDPAFNAAIELVLDHNIAVAGASMEIAAERLRHAAIDPARSRELSTQLLGHISDFLHEFAAVEEEAHRGVREDTNADAPAASPTDGRD